MYESFFRLKGNPFQLSPDPSFFFASRVHSRAFAYLKYGVSQGEGFIVITGEIGAGKTTMVRTLVEELDPELIVPAELISTQIAADELVPAIASAFGVPILDPATGTALGKTQILWKFQSFLVDLANQGRRALLIIDEAQELGPRSIIELRMLSNFQLGARPLLQCFLIGQPELRDLLRGANMEQFRQRVLASYHLGPMDRRESRAYVLHRLRKVGWDGDPSFDDALFEPLYSATGGLPRLINAVCNRLLIAAALEERHRVELSDLTETLNDMRYELGPASKSGGTGGDGEAMDAQHQAAHGPAHDGDAHGSTTAASLARIEAGVKQAVELLQQLVPSEGPGAAPGAAPARAKPWGFGQRNRRTQTGS